MANKKTRMFSDGKVVVASANGDYRIATPEESHEHYVSLCQAKRKDGGVLAAVKFEPETGLLKAKYAYASKEEGGKPSYKEFKKQIVAQAVPTVKEPVDSIQDKKKPNPDPKVPRKPEVGFKQHDGEEPTKVRNEKYTPGEEQSHTDVVPRSKSNSGLKGSDATSYEGVGNNSSGSPDTYVQDYQDNEKPTPAGNEKNHAVAKASTEIDLKKVEAELEDKADLNGIFDREGDKVSNSNSDREIVASDDKDDDDDSDDDGKKKEKKDKMPPWLKKDDDEDGDKEASADRELKARNEKTVSQASHEDVVGKLKAEVNRYKIRESRMKSAIKCALASLQVEPERYSNSDSFLEKVDESMKMPTQAIDNLTESILHVAKSKLQFIEANSRKNNPEGVAPDDGHEFAVNNYKYASVIEDMHTVSANDIVNVFQDGTTLGRKMKEYDNYTPHEKP